MRAVSVLLRVTRLFVLLVALLLTSGSTNVPSVAAQQRTCYRLVKTITCADDLKKDYCQASQSLDFFRQSDGSILGKYKGGKTDECQIQVFPQQGKFKLTCPRGSGEWNWQIPPQTCVQTRTFHSVLQLILRELERLRENTGAKEHSKSE